MEHFFPPQNVPCLKKRIRASNVQNTPCEFKLLSVIHNRLTLFQQNAVKCNYYNFIQPRYYLKLKKHGMKKKRAHKKIYRTLLFLRSREYKGTRVRMFEDLLNEMKIVLLCKIKSKFNPTLIFTSEKCVIMQIIRLLFQE